MDRSEFEQLALEHLDALHRMAFKLCRRADAAEDLVQETYLRAFRAAGTFNERGGGIRAWLFTILHHVHFSKGAREARAPQALPEIFGVDARETIPDEPPPAWDLRSLNWEHVDERLKTAIEELPDEQRVVLLLWGVENMKYREIAGIVGVPVGTIMSRLHRARQTLAKSLEEFRDDLGS